MKLAVVFIIWLLILVIQGCSDPSANTDQTADGDNSECPNDIDIIVLKGSSSDGGKASLKRRENE